MRPTRSQVAGFDFGAAPAAAKAADTLGSHIEKDGENIHRTISGMDWSGDARAAADSRAAAEKVQLTRVADALERVSAAVTHGTASMSHIADRLTADAAGYEGDGFAVADDWKVTDAYNYGLASLMTAGDAEAQQRLADLQRARATAAANATAALDRLVSEFDHADSACAGAIDAASADVSALAPVSSALGGQVADRIADKLSEGRPLTPFERRVLEEGTKLPPDQLEALRNGGTATLPQGQFDFLRELTAELDGKSMDSILALGEGTQHDEIQSNLANASQILGIPNVRTGAGDHGGMQALPANIRSLLTTNMVTGTNPSVAERLLVGGKPRVKNLDEFFKMTDFMGKSDEDLRVGSDVNRGILKQVAEISAVGESPGTGNNMTAAEFDRALDKALAAAATDRIASHDFMTGANMDVTCADGGRYNAGIHLNGLASQEWEHGNAGLHKLFDWVGDEAGSANPYQATMSREAASSLGHYLGSRDDLAVNEGLGVRNPEMARIFANVLSPYLGDFSGINETSGGIHTFGADRLTPGELENIFRSINTDGEAAATLNSSAFKWQNLMAVHYGLDTHQSSLAEHAGVLSQAMTDGNGHAVEYLSDSQFEERMRIYNNQMQFFGTVKDATGLLPFGSQTQLLMQQPLADAIFGEAPARENAANQGNDPDWVAQLNDPKVLQFYQFSGYVGEHPELRQEYPEWFGPNGEPDWDRINKDDWWSNYMSGVSDRWQDSYERGQDRPDWPTGPDNPMPDNPNEPAHKP